MFAVPLVLVAFPEPFDMHSSLGHLIDEALEKQNQMASQDPAEYAKGLENKAMDLVNRSRSDSKETSNDINRPDPSDCR